MRAFYSSLALLGALSVACSNVSGPGPDEAEEPTLVSSVEGSFPAVDMPTRRLWYVAADPAREYLRIRNNGDATSRFTLSLNGVSFADIDSVVAAVRAQPDEFPGEPDYRKAWRFMRANRYHHYAYLYPAGWSENVPLYLNTGFGLCGNTSEALAQLWRAMGYDSRKWALAGHVVSELFADGRWQLFDADIEVYYRDANGNVVGVERLQQEPQLITEPYDPPPNAGFGGNSQRIADIYANAAEAEVLELKDDPGHSHLEFVLPPEATLDLPYVFDNYVRADIGEVVPRYTNARLTLPASFVGPVTLPLLLTGLEGKGRVELEGVEYALGSVELESFLRERPATLWSLSVLALDEPLQLTYLINPLYSLRRNNTLDLRGEELGGLTVKAREHTTQQQVRAWSLNADPDTDVLRVYNAGEGMALFAAELNNRGYGNMAELVSAIRQLPDEFEGESELRKAWRFVYAHRYNNAHVPRSGVSPLVYLDSAGFSFARYAAESLAQIWAFMGYEARWWTLTTHFVAEVFADGRWQMYDAHYGVYYVDDSGTPAGVEALAANPELITAPFERVTSRTYAYSEHLAGKYSTADDNKAYPSPLRYAGLDMQFAVPAGAVLELPHQFEPELLAVNGTAVPSYTNARLTIPSTFSGLLESPFLIQSIAGIGKIRVNGFPYYLGSAELEALLSDPVQYPFFPEIEVLWLNEPLVVTYVLNPAMYGMDTVNDLQLRGEGLTSLEVTAAAVTTP